MGSVEEAATTSSSRARCCVLILCGLPAAGKSTTAEQLVRTAQEQVPAGVMITPHCCAVCVHVE